MLQQEEMEKFETELQKIRKESKDIDLSLDPLALNEKTMIIDITPKKPEKKPLQVEPIKEPEIVPKLEDKPAPVENTAIDESDVVSPETSKNNTIVSADELPVKVEEPVVVIPMKIGRFQVAAVTKPVEPVEVSEEKEPEKEPVKQPEPAPVKKIIKSNMSQGQQTVGSQTDHEEENTNTKHSNEDPLSKRVVFCNKIVI
jgi:hypothetical protein